MMIPTTSMSVVPVEAVPPTSSTTSRSVRFQLDAASSATSASPTDATAMAVTNMSKSQSLHYYNLQQMEGFIWPY